MADSTTNQLVLGIDIGGSGIKGAMVDLEAGDFVGERVKIATPAKSTPENVADVVSAIVDQFADQIGPTPIGITYPGVVTDGIVRSAANVDKSWIDSHAQEIFSEHLGRDVVVVNDADAAGLAEVQFGAAKGHHGKVILVTLGTGIGTAVIYGGVLIPNTEFGHLEIDGHDAETKASSAAKDREGLSYKEWVPRLDRYFSTLEALTWPDLFVVGGGVSRKAEKFLPHLDILTPIIPAALENRAGIIGAAYLANNTATVLAAEQLVDDDPA